MNLGLLPQIVQPRIQQFVHVLLHQQLANLRLDLLQGDDLNSGFFHIGQHLGTVVRFDLLGLHVHIRAQAHFDEIHHLHFVPNACLQLALRESVGGDQLLPDLEKAGVNVVTLEEVSPRIRELLVQQHMDELLDAWLHNLRQQTPVQSTIPLPGPTEREGMGGI